MRLKQGRVFRSCSFRRIAMKDYIWHGKQYQFDESKAPADAVPAEQFGLKPVQKAVETVKKALEPKNKAREAKKK